jgi:hypothetical protein
VGGAGGRDAGDCGGAGGAGDSKKLAYKYLYVSREKRSREPYLKIKLALDH